MTTGFVDLGFGIADLGLKRVGGAALENHPVSRNGCHPSLNLGFGIADLGLRISDWEENHPVSRNGCLPPL
jgi:hypothetical protein